MIEDLAIPFEAFDQVWISEWALAWRDVLVTIDLATCGFIALAGLILMHNVGQGAIRHDRPVEIALKFTCASISVWAFAVAAGYLTGALRFTPPVHVGLNISLALGMSVAIAARMPTGRPKLRVLYAGLGALGGGIVVIVALAVAAYAQSPPDRGPGHADHLRRYHAAARMDEWIRGLKQPGSGFSCCDEEDCARAEADWRDGQWWAVVRGEWTPIPRDKELDKTSIDGDAYVCASPNRRIYCFVRPDIGS